MQMDALIVRKTNAIQAQFGLMVSQVFWFESIGHSGSTRCGEGGLYEIRNKSIIPLAILCVVPDFQQYGQYGQTKLLWNRFDNL